MSIRSFLLLAFGIFCLSSARGQTLYEIDYHFGEDTVKENYKAFIVRHNDGTGLMRVRFNDPENGEERLVEMDMQETYGENDKGEEDTTLLIFVGIQPRFVRGSGKYVPDHFVFQLGAEDFYEPLMVLSIDEDGSNEVTGTLDEVRLMNQEDLSSEFVLQYFNQDESFYNNLFGNTVRGLTGREKEVRLHLLLIANTNDKTIGTTCAVDRDNMLRTFGEIAEFLGIGFNPTVIAGNDFSKVNVEKALNNLRPANNDIVVFYYSGHGFSDRRDSYSYPYLDLRDKSFQPFGGAYTMNMEAVFMKVKTKGARLNLVLSDCCNNDPNQTLNISAEAPVTRTSSVGWSKDKCINLFIEQAGSVQMTAARKGELSAGNAHDGGFFSFHFRETLEKTISLLNTSKTVSWDAIMQDALTQTQARANRTLCRMPDDNLRRCQQTPVFRMVK